MRPRRWPMGSATPISASSTPLTATSTASAASAAASAPVIDLLDDEGFSNDADGFNRFLLARTRLGDRFDPFLKLFMFGCEYR